MPHRPRGNAPCENSALFCNIKRCGLSEAKACKTGMEAESWYCDDGTNYNRGTGVCDGDKCAGEGEAPCPNGEDGTLQRLLHLLVVNTILVSSQF